MLNAISTVTHYIIQWNTWTNQIKEKIIPWSTIPIIPVQTQIFTSTWGSHIWLHIKYINQLWHLILDAFLWYRLSYCQSFHIPHSIRTYFSTNNFFLTSIHQQQSVTFHMLFLFYYKQTWNIWSQYVIIVNKVCHSAWPYEWASVQYYRYVV